MTESRSQTDVQCRRFVVRGRVQGVGFRFYVEREAHMLGVAGWVRNNPDGTVEVLAMGSRRATDGTARPAARRASRRARRCGR